MLVCSLGLLLDVRLGLVDVRLGLLGVSLGLLVRVDVELAKEHEHGDHVEEEHGFAPVGIGDVGARKPAGHHLADDHQKLNELHLRQQGPPRRAHLRK